jgi:hypothetical protein
MPSFEFDVTEPAVEAAMETMSAMPGNPGQEALVQNLVIDAYAIVTVNINGPIVDVKSEYNIDIQSSHPDAISIIIEAGKQEFEQYAEKAGQIQGLVEAAFDLL